MLGTSTRNVDDLMAALGGCSISRSEVSRIRVLLDEELAEFRDRPLDEPYPYVWFDATYEIWSLKNQGRCRPDPAYPVWAQSAGCPLT